MIRDNSLSSRVMVLALAASLVTHVAIFYAARLPSVQARLGGSSELVPAAAPTQVEAWAGTTAELAAGENLYDVQLAGSPELPPAPVAAGAPLSSPAVLSPPAPPPPAPPAKASVPVKAPAAPEKARSTPAPDSKPSAEKPASPPKPPATPKPPTLNPRPVEPPKPEPPVAANPPSEPDPYEEFLPAPKPPSKPSAPPVAAAAKPPAPPVVAAAKPPAPSASLPASPEPKPPATSGPEQPSAGLGGNDTKGGSFGAVGRAGVRDLTRAFAQAIPAACGSDPVWSALPLGDGGTFRLVVDIDESGKLSGWKPVEQGAPKQLLSLGRRTFAMLQSGTFALRGGTVSAGRQTIEVRATVGNSDKAAPAGGEIYLAHGVQADGTWWASFIQPGGREVKFIVRVVRIEVSSAPPG